MKFVEITLGAALLLSAMSSLSQDLVVTNRGDSIRCLITELNSKQIKYTYKKDSSIRHAVVPIGLIRHYKKDFYSPAPEFLKELQDEISGNVTQSTKESEKVSRDATGYYDLIITKNGDSIRCEIVQVSIDMLYYRRAIDVDSIPSETPRSEINSFRYGVFSNSLKNEKTYSKVQFSVDGGLGYRIAKATEEFGQNYKQHLDKLRLGFTLNSSVVFFVSPSIGIGAKYSFYKASNTTESVRILDPSNGWVTGTLADDISISFIGPILRTKITDKDKSDIAGFSFGLGQLRYKNESSFNTNKFDVTGKTLGLSMDFYYAFPIDSRKKNFLGFQIGLVTGSLAEMEIKQGSTSQKVKLEGDERETLSRMDISVGFRFGN